MQAHHLRRALRGRGNAGDGEAGSIGAEANFRGHEAVELLVNRALDFPALGHVFDDHLAGGEVFEFAGEAHASHRFLRGYARQVFGKQRRDVQVF